MDIEVTSQIMKGRTISKQTIDWWRTRTNVPIENGNPQCTVSEMLNDFMAVYASFQPEEVWANPPQFDLAIMHSLGRDFGVEMPWSHEQERDFRTVKRLAKLDFGPRVEVAHDALADAMDQATKLEAMLDALRANDK